ncbi:hypothetical protein SAMN04488007_0671 [Maribacter aquivivus]|uniref:Secreted protein n=1 Tax=Maribacter aquivivus TaxID=228958 RepID=A0A1M6K6K9_9FLAO|nr:hypothetical protein [Maribacter aquivivus]SHJ54470.1 hypothetical protein SAMN04488007_0671 [Maribacter aquivivus]
MKHLFKRKLNYLILILLSYTMVASAQHTIPNEITEEAKIALSHYPELANTRIEFKFKKEIKKSTMQAQPSFWSVFKSKKNRSYNILISERIKIADSVYYTKDIPSEIMIGWLGHELGHVMDYQQRSGFNLIGFGFKYVTSENYIREAERRADSFAVTHGMETYILATKEFILKKAGLTQEYVDRIKNLYLSPEEIMLLVEERDALSQGK